VNRLRPVVVKLRKSSKRINAMSWYILHESGVTGPIEHGELDQKLAGGEIARESMVGRGPDGPWGMASIVFPLAFGIISVTAVPPVFTTEHARRLLAPVNPAARNVKSAPIPLGVSPAASSISEMGEAAANAETTAPPSPS
jgi:hypothetical protein